MLRYDLIVVGGGFAGTAAAIEAARSGFKVLLVDKYNCLGGAAASCLVNPFMIYWTRDEKDEKKYLAGDLFLEIVEKLKESGALLENEKIFDEEILKLVLNRMCIESGVELLFNTTVTDVRVEDGRILSLSALGKSKKLELTAENYIDATGDGELSMMAGCEYKLGRESDSLCQPMTLCFRMGGVDIEEFRRLRLRQSGGDEPTINELYREYQKKGLIKNPRENVLIFETVHDGVLHFNTTRIVKLDPTDPFDVTRAEIEAREQVFEMHKFLRDSFPCFGNSRVLFTALQIGIRESRKIVGEYTLTEEDVLSLRRFDDAIAVSNYDIDIHNPEGAGTRIHRFARGEWYEIPYRCLIPKGIKNMLVAGRCISSTHEAQASYRIMPYCAELGQAAGAAMSLALRDGVEPRAINLKELQANLRARGFII